MSQHRQTIRDAIEQVSADAPHNAHQGWFFRRRIARSERTAVLRRVLLDSDPRWFTPFAVMLALSAGIAALGLSQDSAATVIGAMVIAPLGQPIAALGAAIALVWPRETLRFLGLTAVGALIVVGIAYVIGLLLPVETPTSQVLARTNPDLRDLGVALFAGAAGAYAQTRTSLLSTLTGVAIAVALVPPLAAVGLMLEAGRLGLAGCAFVLFAANLVGIALASAAVLLLTRYAPLPRLRSAGWKSVGLLTAVVLVLALVGAPLTAAYLRLIDNSEVRTMVYQQVADTLGPNSGAVLEKVTVESSGVIIDLTGGTDVAPASVFERDLADELGPDVTVVINQK